MVDAPGSAMAPSPMTITQSRTSWGFELGRQGLIVTRSRDTRTIGARYTAVSIPPPARRFVWPFAIGTFVSVSAFGLVVFGALAAEPALFSQPSRYLLSVPVPARAPRHAISPRPHRLKSRWAALAPSSPLFDESIAGDRFGVEDELYAAKAMRTGKFQEWLGADNQRRFMTAGPAQIETSHLCRNLVLLVRQMDGSSQTQSARRCMNVHSGAIASGIAEDVRHNAITPDAPESLLFQQTQSSHLVGEAVSAQTVVSSPGTLRDQ